MHALMYLVAVLTFLGGLVYGGLLVGEPLTRAAGFTVMAGAFVTGMLYVAVGKVLDRLDEIQTVIGKPSR